MIALGGLEIAGSIGIALAVGTAAIVLIVKMGDFIGRDIDVFFGVGGHWAHERRVQDDSADDPYGCHGVTASAETTSLNSGNPGFLAGVRADD